MVDCLTLHDYKAAVGCTHSFSKFFSHRANFIWEKEAPAISFLAAHLWFFTCSILAQYAKQAVLYCCCPYAVLCVLRGWHRTLFSLLVWWHQLPVAHLWRGACVTHHVLHSCGTLHTSVGPKYTPALKRAGEWCRRWCAVAVDGEVSASKATQLTTLTEAGSALPKLLLWLPWAGTSWSSLEGGIWSNFCLVGLLMQHRVGIWWRGYTTQEVASQVLTEATTKKKQEVQICIGHLKDHWQNREGFYF